MISRFFDFSSKPGSCPESPDSHIIPTRQEISSRKRGGGVLATASHDARVVDPEASISRNRPLSALIAILGPRLNSPLRIVRVWLK